MGFTRKKNNFVLGGMLWLKMRKRPFGTAIDLSDLGLDQIEEMKKNFASERMFRFGNWRQTRR